MSEWTTLAASGDIPLGSGKEFIVGERVIAVFHTEAGFHAIDGICMHAGGPLAQGQIKGCIVTCPWHGWQYDVASGKHQLNSRLQQQTFDVRVEGDQIQIQVPAIEQF